MRAVTRSSLLLCRHRRRSADDRLALAVLGRRQSSSSSILSSSSLYNTPPIGRNERRPVQVVMLFARTDPVATHRQFFHSNVSQFRFLSSSSSSASSSSSSFSSEVAATASSAPAIIIKTDNDGDEDEDEKNEEIKITKSSNVNNVNNTNINKDHSVTENLSRLLELSRSEWSLIGLAASTLAVTSSVTLLLPYASGSVIDYTIITSAGGSGGDGAMSPLLLASGLFGLSALAGGGVYLRSLWLARAGNRIVARLKQRLYTSILRQESAFWDQRQTTTGDLLSRLTSDAQLVQGALTTQAVSGLRATVMSLGAGGMMVYTSPVLTVVSGATLPPIFILARYFGRRLSQQQEEVQSMLGEATSLAEQAISHTSTVKQFTAEDFEATRYRNAIASAHSKSVDTAHMQAQLEAGAHIAGNAAILGVLGMGGQMVLEGSISAGDLTGFVMYSLLLAGNLSSLTGIYSDLVRGLAASARIFDLMDRTPQIVSQRQLQHEQSTGELVLDPLQQLEFQDAVVAAGNENTTATSTTTTKSPSSADKGATIEFNNLSFHYPSRPDVPVLKNFDLTVPPGSVVALVGSSGSGKSTIANLLTRLYDADDIYQHDFVNTHHHTNDSHQPPIQINGMDIRDLDPLELRKMISVVSQDPVLFRGSIRDNVRYGQWDRVTEEDVTEAARNAFVLDFAMNFPDGLDTMVGARGMELSGGQRQRIAIARMLANKTASIYILDEATSALDAASEHYVQSALQKLFQEHRNDKTIISIAHRLSTIRHATTIAVIDKGAVVQTGSFDDLSTTDGPFRELMKTQLVGGTPK